KVVDARMTEERLEGADARVEQGLHAAGSAGHDASVKSAIDPRLPRGGLLLLLQGIQVRGHGTAVQRHVYERGYAPRGRSPRRGPEAFPFRATRFVDVDMRLNQPGQNDELTDVENVTGERRRTGVVYGDDALAADPYVGRAATARRANSPAAQHPFRPQIFFF